MKCLGSDIAIPTSRVHFRLPYLHHTTHERTQRERERESWLLVETLTLPGADKATFDEYKILKKNNFNYERERERERGGVSMDL